ncbi:hypothetical protein BST83_02465 [Polaribacter filamentus]|uniref:DUF5689 domain-containing protein n=1 Tax=Polaribacter filamentus TaxID=53483 RepID=A0A2S7KU54_9FLAO|nr:hypothetical protein [Polaribacter filamentus]PQB06171.1 hypothetical protein BST83_02465 [Polaribacter filamentus]
MKKIKYILLTLFTIATVVSCIDEDNDELTGDATTGGLLKLNNRLIGYVVGDGASYTATGNVFQGREQTNSVGVYIAFTNSITGETSNEVLYETIDISETTIGATGSFSTSFTYENLIEGLSLSTGSLPASDGELSIGDFWELRYVSTLNNGKIVSNSSTTKVSVGTRFAGTYRPLDGAYYRIGVETYVLADWINYCPVTTIESVDATTYRVVEYFGPFNGNEWYFQIDGNDKITYPANTPAGEAQLGNGQPFITCESNAADMTDVPCGPLTNFVTRFDNGADQLTMSFGYFTSGSGARTFYQVLEKIVD